MKFDELDKKLRQFESLNDRYVLPGIYIVARLDGRCFTKLTKEICQFEAPYDAKFRDLMLETVKHLMTCGIKITYGYTQSDEISLLFALNEGSFQRKERKLNSILASEAGAKFSLLLGRIASFDCRICQLPTPELIVDYFRWRNEDAHRNSLNSHCYWALRRDGVSAQQVVKQLDRLSVAQKNELLFQHNINFNDLPNWQKRGVGLYWETYEIEGTNPKTGETAKSTRRRLKVDLDLPMKDEYSQFIRQLIGNRE
ncbi:tRNAHis-5'-guanylyltransferase [Geitlerinema sp. FC II]|nr:tRNAHis-5'-guanylyltransferase [Geitlerinema sp. FC II]